MPSHFNVDTFSDLTNSPPLYIRFVFERNFLVSVDLLAKAKQQQVIFPILHNIQILAFFPSFVKNKIHLTHKTDQRPRFA